MNRLRYTPDSYPISRSLTAKKFQANFRANPSLLNGPKLHSRPPSSVPKFFPCSPRPWLNDWRVCFDGGSQAIQHAAAIQEKDAAEETKLPRVDNISGVIVTRCVR